MLTASTVAALALAGFGITFAGLVGAFLWVVRKLLQPPLRGEPQEPPPARKVPEPDVAALLTEVRSLHDRMSELREWVAEEVKNAKREHARARATLSRARALSEGGGDESDADQDGDGEHAAGSGGGGVPAVSTNLELPFAGEAVDPRMAALQRATLFEALN